MSSDRKKDFTYSKKLLEEVIRSSKDFSISNFSNFIFRKRWKSDHAEFYYFSVEENNEPVYLVAKKYVHLDQPHEAMYTMAHQPDLLYSKEKRNLEVILETLPSFLTPKIYGSSQKDKVLFIEYLGNLNKKKELKKALELKTSEVMDTKFLEGVKNIAIFNGLCNAHEEDFNKIYNYDTDLNMFKKASLSLLKENMVRFFYINNADVKKMISSYDYDLVNDYLKSKKNIDVDLRLNEISELNKFFNEKLRLQHNDCNGLNMVGQKLIDLEKFGYGSWTNDISSYCIIVGLGENDVVDNFSRSRHLYLCYEDAYKKGDEDLVASLDTYENGMFKNRVAKIMNQEDYANWTMSFFARAIDKFIQLESSYGRYNIGENSEETNLNRIYNLFSTIERSDFIIKSCSEEEGIRDYFNAYGNLLLDLELYSNHHQRNFTDILERIKFNIVTSNLPDFKKKK